MGMYSDDINALQDLLLEKAVPTTKAWWEGYVKDSAPFLGVKMADTRAILHSWYRDRISTDYPLEEQLDLALELFKGQYTEEKLAGTLFLKEILLPQDALNCVEDLKRMSTLFAGGLIFDWNICDWFSIKVLGSLIERYGTACAELVSAWHAADNLWQARASLVAFVPVAGNDKYYPLVEKSCQQIIMRDERFAKTAVGWILRDISKYDQPFVGGVIEQNAVYFSTESLKNATKYFNSQEKNRIRDLVKAAKIE
jgi:3-methyladenine DNA glycosylase AlkD